MENQNRKHKIIITVDRSVERIERIDIEPEGRLHGDAVGGFLAKLFRPAPWAAVRELVRIDGKRVFAGGGE